MNLLKHSDENSSRRDDHGVFVEFQGSYSIQRIELSSDESHKYK